MPERVWYIIPAHRVTGRKGKSQITLGQFAGVRNRPKYECYRKRGSCWGRTERRWGGCEENRAWQNGNGGWALIAMLVVRVTDGE